MVDLGFNWGTGYLLESMATKESSFKSETEETSQSESARTFDDCRHDLIADLLTTIFLDNSNSSYFPKILPKYVEGATSDDLTIDFSNREFLDIFIKRNGLFC